MLTSSNGISDEDIGHNAAVWQWLSSDRGGVMPLQPFFKSASLIAVPICRNHWLYHDGLDASQAKVSNLLSQVSFTAPAVSLDECFDQHQLAALISTQVTDVLKS